MNRAKVLVVDDDENNRFICQLHLNRQGYTVLLAVDGQDALDLSISELPDLRANLFSNK
ncbi:MAG: hypothetical protein HQK97_10085 [Nitrospirae bacterium]|nr:hypothetical protein [Nitrospirota bacterium]